MEAPSDMWYLDKGLLKVNLDELLEEEEDEEIKNDNNIEPKIIDHKS